MGLILHKIRHWEYWPTWMIYVPVFFLYLYYTYKAKNLFYFIACNPAFRNGGFSNISKKDIYDLIPTQYYPKTLLVQPEESLNVEKITQHFQFPFIVKPDKGLRGILVKKINSIDELNQYHKQIISPYLIQEYVAFEKEIGIFYVRKPNEESGHITGITEKKFLTIIGDGMSTIEKLLSHDKRHAMQLKTLKKDANIDFNEIIKAGEKKIIVPFGNHSRGTLFLDASHQITPQLSQTIDSICKQIKGFYYGRIDLRFNTWDDLAKGINLSIIEINGALSEPTHIYDPKHSFLFAIKETMRHYRLKYEISMVNQQIAPQSMSIREMKRELTLHFQEIKKLKLEYKPS